MTKYDDKKHYNSVSYYLNTKTWGLIREILNDQMNLTHEEWETCLIETIRAAAKEWEASLGEVIRDAARYEPSRSKAATLRKIAKDLLTNWEDDTHTI